MAKAKEGAADAFGKALRESREGQGLTQAELATRARLSSRTIFRAEKGTAIPGRDLVIRLALALSENPAAWLRVAKLPVPAAKDLEAAKKRFALQQDAEASEITGAPFDALIDQIGEGLSRDQPKLMCVCYSSRPSAIVRTEIIEQVSELVSRGLSLAMFCPYPPVSEGMTFTNFCARHYSEVLKDVVYLAIEYRNASKVRGSPAADQIQLFLPRDRDQLWVPPATSFALRPTLIAKLNSTDSECRLGAIVELPYDNEPRWFDMHGGHQHGHSKYGQLLSAWRWYFDPALRTWKGPGEWELRNFDDKSWTLWDFSGAGTDD